MENGNSNGDSDGCGNDDDDDETYHYFDLYLEYVEILSKCWYTGLSLFVEPCLHVLSVLPYNLHYNHPGI